MGIEDDPVAPLPIPFFRAWSGGRGRKVRAARPAQEQTKTPPKPIEVPEGMEDMLPSFRPRSGVTAPATRPEKAHRGRERNRKERPAPEPPAAAPIAPLVPEPVQPAVLELIRIPADAPQVVVRDGVPTLVRDGQAYPPILFFANPQDEDRLKIVLEEVHLAAEAGVHIVSLYLDFVIDPDQVDESVAMAGYLIRKVLSVDPNAQVILRTAFSAPVGWDSHYKKGRYTLEEGGIADPSVCDDDLWTVAEDCLREFVVKLRMLDESQSVMGLHLEYGEWFYASGMGYDTSAAAEEAFRTWCRTRYRNDIVALCAAWFDGQAQFETISVPQFGGEVRAGEQFVRTGRHARRWVDYHLFLSDIIVDRIGKLAHVVKHASEGYFIVGVSYGYTFEWSHPSNGHLSLGKLLRNPEVDFIAGPPSYRNREPGGSAPFPCPIDSFALNGKLYISEEDFKTPISGRVEPDDFNTVMRTPQALDSVHWRGFGAAAAHNSGVCWMDLWGNGWLKTPSIWERARQIRSGLIHRLGNQPAAPSVAVFIDERSLAYLVDPLAFELLIQNVRESVLRSGLSVGFYLLSDLAHREQFPDSKIHVFINAWDIRPEVRGAIKSRLQKDGKYLFWLYAAGLFDSGREALERVREVTGIAIKRQPFASKSGTSVIHKKHPLCEALPEKQLSQGSELEPSYFAIPEEDSVVLAEYTSTGLPSLLLKEIKSEEGHSWTSIFMGEAVVSPALFRNLGQLAGEHIWNHQEDLVHAQQPFLTLHCKGAGVRTLTLPDKWQAYNLVTEDWMPTEGNYVRFQATDGSTHSFLVGVKSEIEALLKRPEKDVLSGFDVLERPSNTLRLDEIHFDVPIMKLDEWVEDSWNEEMSDDLILRPSQIELESFDTRGSDDASTSRSDSRRRGRRRQRDRGGKNNQSGSKDFDVMEMNVVFRKRD